MDQSIILLILLAILMVPMFLQMRRQKKHQNDMAALQDSLTVGMPVLTSCGLHGVITRDNGSTVLLKIAADTEVVWEKATIIKIVDPTAPDGE